MRDHSCVFSKVIHRGSVNFISSTMSSTLVTGSADSSCKILDVFMGFNVRNTLNASSAVLCGEIVDNLVVTGGADGNVIVFNMDTGDACFGFGADNVGGVNCLGVTSNKKKLITGGDKGMPLLLNF